MKTVSFAKVKESYSVPNLLEHQLKSYKDFLQMDIPAELLNTTQTFTLTYDGYMTEPIQVLLSEPVPLPNPVILGVTDITDGPATIDSTDIIINGTNLSTQGSISIKEILTNTPILYGPVIWSENSIEVYGIDFTPYAGSEIEITVTANDLTSEPFIFTI